MSETTHSWLQSERAHWVVGDRTFVRLHDIGRSHLPWHSTVQLKCISDKGALYGKLQPIQLHHAHQLSSNATTEAYSLGDRNIQATGGQPLYAYSYLSRVEQ